MHSKPKNVSSCLLRATNDSTRAECWRRVSRSGHRAIGPAGVLGERRASRAGRPAGHRTPGDGGVLRWCLCDPLIGRLVREPREKTRAPGIPGAALARNTRRHGALSRPGPRHRRPGCTREPASAQRIQRVRGSACREAPEPYRCNRGRVGAIWRRGTERRYPREPQGESHDPDSEAWPFTRRARGLERLAPPPHRV